MEKNLSLIEKYFKNSSTYIYNVDDKEDTVTSNKMVKQLISDTKELMKYIKSENCITYTQLRNVYQLFKDEAMDFKKIQLMRPKLAYIQARLEKPAGRDFIQMIDDFIERVDSDPQISEKQIKKLIAFMESIVAYHKLNS
jgi:CRISPR type III-A-associated protein Csm2